MASDTDNVSRSRTVAEELRDVGQSHQMLSSFFERYAALLRAADDRMKERGFLPMGKNPRCYVSCSGLISLSDGSNSWLPSYAIYGWKRKDRACWATLALRFKNGEIPELMLTIARSTKQDLEDLGVLQDLACFEPKVGGEDWTPHQLDLRSKAQYQLDFLRLPLDRVESRENLDVVVVGPLVGKYEEAIRVTTPPQESA